MRAYVLINVSPGKSREVVAAVARLRGVRRAAACWGLPDIFVEVEIPSEKALEDLVIGQIQNFEGVERTETHLVAE